MNVAVVSPYSWSHTSGVNNHIYGFSKALTLRGHRVTIVAPDGGPVPPGVRFVSSGRSVPVPSNGSIARLALSPLVPSRLREVLTSARFDIVHVHEPLVPMTSLMALRYSTSPLVGTFHATGEGPNPAYRIASVTLKHLHARLGYRIAVSPAAKELASRYVPGEYEIIPNAIDLDRFTPAREKPETFPADASHVVLFVGRMEKRKGLNVLLEAFPRVLSVFPGCRLVIAGEGYDDPSFLGRYDLGDSVIIRGYVSDEELPAFYSGADVFCAPSLGGESFGMILIESMACGTPVVASDIPGYSDLVRETGGGLLFKRGDAESLASALVTVLGDESLKDELARDGLAAASRFSWDVVALRIEEVYGSLMGSGRGLTG